MSFQKAALVIDVRNLYMQVNRAFPGHILRYSELLARLEAKYSLRFIHKIAYMTQPQDLAQKFIGFLKSQNFEVHCDDISWNVEMALRCATILPTVDALVLGTNNIEHGRILRYAKESGKFTYAIGTHFPTNFRNVAELFTIDESLICPKVPNGQQLVVPTESNSNADRREVGTVNK